MSSDRSKIGLIILVIILLLLIVFFGGYIVYDKAFTDKEGCASDNITSTSSNKNSTQHNIKKSLGIDSRLVIDLYNEVYDDRDGQDESYIYPNDKDKILASELEEDKKLSLVYQNIKASEVLYFSGCDTRSTTNVDGRRYTCTGPSLVGKIPNDVVERVYKKIFGTSATISDKEAVMYTDISKSTIYVPNTNEEKDWILYTTTGGSVGAYTYDRKIERAISFKDTIEIYENIKKTDLDGNKKEEKILYTFKLGNDGVYTFYSWENIKSNKEKEK